MKKLKTIITMMVLAAGLLSLSSCQDNEIARTLQGAWRGDIIASRTWCGIEYQCSYTELYFAKDPGSYSSGTGYWYEEYSGAPWDYFASNMTWTVTNGVIYIHLSDSNEDYRISNYRLTDNQFSGRFYSEGIERSFNLYYDGDWYWNNYNTGWDSWYFDYGGYAKGKKPAGDAVPEHPTPNLY